MKTAIQKCAIYTRKSTDKGLEQDFNTLDAQREACLAFITSQKSEGWVAEKQHYDDGGYSGGSLERPALQQLLEDVKAGKINVIVVYKIDRLTRSLADFAKLVEIFDQHGVSFVSVTQSFNTTTSMGRLTLNVLLSFAQFEREVIGERIRDKVAASKKKGMWMGGNPMLGYDIKDRQLIINEIESKTVSYIFNRYLELKSVRRLKDDLDQKNIKSKSWTTSTGRQRHGKNYGYGALHHLLSNPVYAGYIHHKGEMYEGAHQAIIPREKWQQVQDILVGNACSQRGQKKQSVKNILKGKIFDTDGTLYTPMRSNKNGKQYHYYVSQNQIRDRSHPKEAIARLPAYEIETLVLDALKAEIRDAEKLSTMLSLDPDIHSRMLEYISENADTLHGLHKDLHRVIVDCERLTIEVCPKSLAEQLKEVTKLDIQPDDKSGHYRIEIPYHTKRAHRGAVMIRPGNGKDPLDLPKPQLEALVKGIVWRDQHFAGKPLQVIATENDCSRAQVYKLIQQSLEIA